MIFCVEDDDNARDLMVYTLNASGFPAQGFPDGPAFFAALREQRPRLVILDIMLPGQDGLEILSQLKKNSLTASIPIIMASAKGAEYDKIAGLDKGADDYLAKPFGMMEMVARVKAVLRRAGPRREDSLINLGGITLDPAAHTALAQGQPVNLTLKEYELLRLLMEHPGRVFTRDQLLSQVWDLDYDGETRTVDAHIRSLRLKLGGAGESIQTVRGLGYRMEAKL